MLESLFNKVARLRLKHRYFAVDMAKHLRTAFFEEHLWWLLLNVFRDGIKETGMLQMYKHSKLFQCYILLFQDYINDPVLY